jgi:hypothetical protein
MVRLVRSTQWDDLGTTLFWPSIAGVMVSIACWWKGNAGSSTGPQFLPDGDGHDLGEAAPERQMAADGNIVLEYSQPPKKSPAHFSALGCLIVLLALLLFIFGMRMISRIYGGIP